MTWMSTLSGRVVFREPSPCLSVEGQRECVRSVTGQSNTTDGDERDH